MPDAIVKTEISPNPPLGRVDWLRTALEILISEGVDAVQITRLAKEIGATRGSFYWHFENRPALLEAILKEWQTANFEIFDLALTDCRTLDDAILTFFAIWENEQQFYAAFDQSVRDWARLDPDILKIVRKEDTRRLDAIANTFIRFGYTDQEANVRARVLYFGQVGYTAINLGEAMDERLALLDDYYLAFTGRTLDKNIARQFIEKMKSRS